MANLSNSTSNSDDAFSGMPEFKSHPKETGVFKKNQYDTSAYAKLNQTNATNASGAHKIKSETGTKIYIGKKITDSHEFNRVQKNKDTTLTDVSIDTDYLKKPATRNEEKPALKFSDTTISPEKNSQDYPTIEDVGPIIVEEEIQEQTKPPVSNPPANNPPHNNAKKEKVAQQNISLDISSGFVHEQIPSGEEQVPLGSGVITGILGSGGMAKVYRIWNEKLELYRAVKILIPTNQKTNWTRFQTESKISAKLHHPNIIEVHNVGEWRGIPYMEMEIVEGDTLSSLMHKFKTLPSFVTSAIAVQVARALAYAHSQEIMIYGKTYKGIIHRDLKPSNIMVGKNGIVKLMDFGVARPVEAGLHTVDTESIVGTIHYFSPEQISGYPIDPLSDIYSFGAVVYEMICGKNPFPQTTMVNLIRAKEKNQFIRLEDFQLPADPRLMSVAQVCLRTDKNARFQSAAQLRDHLEQVHASLAAGMPEDVVVRFLDNPEAMFEENRHMYTPVIKE
ncbi:MAG: serine/threonine protein kinase, partial [Fibrobacter sp.]|nr:serine/threonine protein kinase [Fibrobacter sp.]